MIINNIKPTAWFLPILLFASLPVWSQTLNNHTKAYTLVSQTEASNEATRTNRMLLCDYQPTGLYVRDGETLIIDVDELNQDYSLSSMIGNKQMWGFRNKTQEDVLQSGSNTVRATQDGILSFIFVKDEGYDSKPATLNVQVKGGKAFPLYHFNRTNPLNWKTDLKRMKGAPFVQLISDKALITIPYKDYLRSPIKDLEKTFKTLHQVIYWQDELAGFDNSSPENTRTRNRLHYMVDLYSTPLEAEEFSFYAMDHLIGMKPSNFTDLTEKLSTEWGIWHETGHTHQQNSWTWNSISEVSVNIFSLYVQEKFGRPSWIAAPQNGESQTSLQKAQAYIARKRKDYLNETPEELENPFTKLVMFHHIRYVYGWDIFKSLHQYFRRQPYVEIEGETDADKANKFIYAMCVVTQNNLMPFFQKWGLGVDAITAEKVKALHLPLPPNDPAKGFYL